MTRPSGEQNVQAEIRFAEIEHVAVQAAIAFEGVRASKVSACRARSLVEDFFILFRLSIGFGSPRQFLAAVDYHGHGN